MGQKIAIFLLSSLYLFDSTFLFWLYYSGIVWIDKLHNCVPTWFVVYLENWEKILSHFSWERLQRGKIASSITLSYRFELPLKKLSWLDEVLNEKKCCNLKKLYLAKKGTNVQKNIFTYISWLPFKCLKRWFGFQFQESSSICEDIIRAYSRSNKNLQWSMIGRLLHIGKILSKARHFFYKIFYPHLRLETVLPALKLPLNCLAYVWKTHTYCFSFFSINRNIWRYFSYFHTQTF